MTSSLPPKLLALLEQDKHADRARFASRQANLALSPNNVVFPEIEMNPQSIIESIETNRSVMEAQIKRMQLDGGLINFTGSGDGNPVSFEAMVNGVLINAGQTIQALYQTEQQVRNSLANAQPSTSAVIDGEAQVIDEGGTS